ncbi:MAG: hypothetical protein ACLPPF_05665 [Rhodomicrobium sp.]
MTGVPQEALPQEDLDRLVKHLQEEEVQAQRAKLSSVESLKVWVSKHPGLQQTSLMETLSVYGPAVLEMLKRVLGV